MSALNDSLKIYSVETNDGYEQYYKTKEEALANSPDGVVTARKVERDEIHEILVKYFTTCSKRAKAGRKGQEVWKDKYSSEERSKMATNGGKVRAEQRWGKK